MSVISHEVVHPFLINTKRPIASKTISKIAVFVLSSAFWIPFILLILNVWNGNSCVPAILALVGGDPQASATNQQEQHQSKLPQNQQTLKQQNHGVLEQFVLSLSQDKFRKFLQRNHEDLQNATWIVSEDGYEQSTLNRYAEIAGLEEVLNAKDFEKGNQAHKDAYKSSHAVGCYLSHWQTLDMLMTRPASLRPEAYLILEDDAQCIPNVTQLALEVARQLPKDWDILYLGGKPITYYPDPKGNFKPSLNESEVRTMSCAGDFGSGSSPLAPDGTRYLSYNQPYWRTKYMANTHAYILNPKNLQHIHSILKPTKYVPIDMLLGDEMRWGDLKAYMTTREWCHGKYWQPKYYQPRHWLGWWMFEHGGSNTAETRRMYDQLGMEHCKG